MEQSPCEANNYSSSREIPRLDPEGSAPSSQQLATGSYPEPDAASPHRPTEFPQDPFQYYRPINVWVLRVVSSLLVKDSAPRIWWQVTMLHGHGFVSV